MQSKVKPIILCITIFFFLTGISVAADALKIGVMDFKEILEVSEAGKKARDEIQKEGQKMETDFKAKTDEIGKLESQIERESMVMSKEKREEKIREMRIKKNDIKTLRAQYMEELRVLETRIIGRIEKEVATLVRELGKSGKYTYILDRRIGGVIYYNDAIDITDKIIEAYDKQFSKQKK
jgi:outer membrane protein